MMATTDGGKPFRMMNVIDEFTRECLAIQVARTIKAGDVEACLTELFCNRGVPEHTPALACRCKCSLGQWIRIYRKIYPQMVIQSRG